MQNEKELFKRSIIGIEQIVENSVFLMSFSTVKSFMPGQVVALTSDLNIPARLYSIASGNEEDEMRVLFDVIPEGKLTNQLSKLKVGDDIYVSEPFGKFTCDNTPAYWIAAGTGIAPFASMFYSGLVDNKILIHGGRTINSFYFEGDFKPVFGDNYIRCCSQEKGNGVYEGRLTTYLRSQNNLPKDYKYYLCGSSEMVVETRDILISKGIAFDKIIAEIYF